MIPTQMRRSSTLRLGENDSYQHLRRRHQIAKDQHRPQPRVQQDPLIGKCPAVVIEIGPFPQIHAGADILAGLQLLPLGARKKNIPFPIKENQLIPNEPNG